MTTLALATSKGLFIAERVGSTWNILRKGLEDQVFTCVTACQGVILAGTRDGVFRSDDEGMNWEETSSGLSIRYVRWLTFHPDNADRVFAGTEPAGIFVSNNSTQGWRACPEVESLRKAKNWYLPYSPEAGCVRDFAFHGERVYAAVEVGGILRSDDGGEIWHLLEQVGEDTVFVHPDVHSLSVHASSPDLIYTPTGDGFYRSDDGGNSWEQLYRCYCRAVWVDPTDTQHIILGPADGVDRMGRIEESHDGGETWTPATKGLDTSWSSHMVERFTQVGDDLFAVLSNGSLLTTSLVDLHWGQILPVIGKVTAVATID